MEILSVNDGMVKVIIALDEVFDIDYEMVKDFVLTETGYTIVNEEHVLEQCTLALHGPGSQIVWHCPINFDRGLTFRGN